MKRFTAILASLVMLLGICAAVMPQEVNANPPASPVRLIFIHHSTGENWLNDENGGLARALQQNNYYPSDTNYGWGPGGIGDRTDIPNWVEWFRGDNTPAIMQAVFTEGDVHSPFERTLTDPGGENQIILFKSCFPNSALEGSPNDPPTPGTDLNVGNAKFIYNEILQYFKTRPDKLFVVITAPPLTDGTLSNNARAFDEWLVNDWLKENNYTQPNVAVFDFYNILTGPNNHHRFNNGAIEHVTNDKRNTEYYPSEDDHPNSQGNRKATQEFLPMLNIFYNRWKAAGTAAPAAQPQNPAPTAKAAGENPPAAPTGMASGMLYDFESEQPVWEVSVDEAVQSTALDCQNTNILASGGSQSMQIMFNVAANSWATCSNFSPAPRDLSQSDGIQFNLYVKEPGTTLHFDVFTGPNGERATNAHEIPLPAAGKWVTIQTKWADLKRVEWETDGGTVFSHPEQITGFAFGFPAGDAVNKGLIYIDDIQTFKAGQAVNPPQTDVKPAAANLPAQEEPRETSKRNPLLPFCGSALPALLGGSLSLLRFLWV
jgi:hypothetical protein